MSASIVVQTRKPDGPPTDADFATVTVPLPEVAEGLVGVSTTFISVDPYMRPAMNDWTPPAQSEPLKAFGGASIGKVTESRAQGFAVGDLVIGRWGWADRAVCKADDVRKLGPHALANPPTALNLFGDIGLTAFMGVEQILNPKTGDTVYVSNGAGSVGAAVGMMVKRRAHVDSAAITLVGSAGSQAKLDYMKSIGYDAVFNYKEEPVATALARLAPRGIDCYFDLVGGETSLAAVSKMNDGGRVAVCGCIHMYNSRNIAGMLAKKVLVGGSPLHMGLRKTVFVDFALALKATRDAPQPAKTLKLSGRRTITWQPFNVGLFSSTAEGRAAAATIASWVADGSLPNAGREDVVRGGLEDLPRTFARMLAGGNNGKQVLELVADGTK